MSIVATTASKIARDISERKQAEARLADLYEAEREARAQAEAATRAKNRFLANLTHDLRTPLNSMMGMAQVLLMQAIGPSTNASKPPPKTF